VARKPHGKPASPSGEASSKVRVARIGAAHGVHGEVRFWPFTEDPEAALGYGPLETEDGTRTFEVESLRPAKDFFVARLKGVDDRTAAEKLTNLELFMPRDRLPPIEEDDTWYQADLVGLSAVTPAGDTLGTILAIHNFGAGDVVEIALAGGSKTLMLPFTESAVPEVDVKNKRMVVVVPEESEAVVPGDRAPARKTRDP
jgi:16S rRNA processing protein RimM